MAAADRVGSAAGPLQTLASMQSLSLAAVKAAFEAVDPSRGALAGRRLPGVARYTEPRYRFEV
jgi:hypothetical protein